ncbi:putative mrna-decapping enzyme 2 [Phaeomoniella chlamydospora]|uniref:Putative mrna-decapping enzyme 2 n=1 Tax=Phaeomoniella chlamydospora TaxID=158046 RepID=A0A0G2E975_PHACM|nr:putative mrna-decapping enzyme 2 [Phaeomoniella chlamydospora]
MKLEDWLDDLCVRFIINLPHEELGSVERICFQIEEAQWFYEDFIRPLDPSLPSLPLRNFSLLIFQHCPLFAGFPQDFFSEAFSQFLAYKTRVPVRGAILLNEAMDHVLLVKGWKKNANWSFPRGKINKDEKDLDCAVREVYEETGYDIKGAGLVPDESEAKYISVTIREQDVGLYVFRSVPMDVDFQPKTRKEISKVKWYKLADLPTFKRNKHQEGNGQSLAMNANKFYMVAPFLHELRKWISFQRKRDAIEGRHLAARPAFGEAAAVTEDEQELVDPNASGPVRIIPRPSDLPEVTLSHERPTDVSAHLKALLNVSNVVPQETKVIPISMPPPSLLPANTQAVNPARNATNPTPASVAPYLQTGDPTFAGLQRHGASASVVPPASSLPPLNSHARTLLDAFRSPPMPTASLQSDNPTKAVQSPVQQQSGSLYQSTGVSRPEVNARQASTQHHINLLGLFRQTPPQSNAVEPLGGPSRNQNGPAELSAQPPSSAGVSSQNNHKDLLMQLFKQKGSGPPLPNFAPLQKPSAPIQILQRTTQEAQSPMQGMQRPNLNASQTESPNSTPKPFQPQILRRPAEADRQLNGTVQHLLNTPSAPTANSTISHDRRTSQTETQKRALLSLFNKQSSATSHNQTHSTIGSPASGAMPSTGSIINPLDEKVELGPEDVGFTPPPRSRMGSTSTLGSVITPTVTRTTTASDRAFLLQYLGVAKGN